MNSHLHIVIDDQIQDHERHRALHVKKIIVTQSLHNWFLINEHQHIPVANGDLIATDQHVVRFYIQNQFNTPPTHENNNYRESHDALAFLNHSQTLLKNSSSNMALNLTGHS